MKFTRNPGFVSADMDGDTVMMSVESGAYFGITGIGPRIWELLAQPMTRAEVTESLSTQYDVDPQTLAADVASFFEDMQTNGLIDPA